VASLQVGSAVQHHLAEPDGRCQAHELVGCCYALLLVVVGIAQLQQRMRRLLDVCQQQGTMAGSSAVLLQRCDQVGHALRVLVLAVSRQHCQQQLAQRLLQLLLQVS
jgi:hypothetical protein